VTGPRVPPFVAPPPPAVTATFTITLTGISGSVPVCLGDFTITDQLGRTFVPSLVAGEANVAFRVNAVLAPGEGRIHWRPAGTAPVVTWDFVVEND
jgi:hypothetical protein